MKMKCAHCGNTIDPKGNFCEFCGTSTFKRRSKRGSIRVLSVIGGIAALFAVVTVLHENYLMPWQIPLYNTRGALIQYMKQNHPNYHIVKEEVKYQYNTNGGFLPKPGSGIPYADVVCDEEGFEYTVHAFDGKVTRDAYARNKLGCEIEFAEKEFLEPRGIENVDFYCTFDLDKVLPSEWSEYNDAFRVTIYVRGQGSTPREVGWLWDFYGFWRDNQHFNPNWDLRFYIYSSPHTSWDSSISIRNTENFGSKEEWYAENTYIPNPRPMH